MFLDNLHLMQGWIPKLERKLEVAAESAHPGFQCFFSAEPINGAPQAKIIPESILQMCIKVSNEPPSDMRSNMRRAFAAFTPEAEDRLSTAAKRTAYKSILFGLCFYHSLLLGRKKFGTGIGTGGNVAAGRYPAVERTVCLGVTDVHTRMQSWCVVSRCAVQAVAAAWASAVATPSTLVT